MFYPLFQSHYIHNAEFRDVITELPKGQFVFPEIDLKLTTEPFIQQGVPYEVKLKIPEQKKQPKPLGFIGFMKYRLNLTQIYPKGYEPQQQTQNSEETEKDDGSEYDGVLGIDDKNALFPEEEF